MYRQFLSKYPDLRQNRNSEPDWDCSEDIYKYCRRRNPCLDVEEEELEWQRDKSSNPPLFRSNDRSYITPSCDDSPETFVDRCGCTDSDYQRSTVEEYNYFRERPASPAKWNISNNNKNLMKSKLPPNPAKLKNSLVTEKCWRRVDHEHEIFNGPSRGTLCNEKQSMGRNWLPPRDFEPEDQWKNDFYGDSFTTKKVPKCNFVRRSNKSNSTSLKDDDKYRYREQYATRRQPRAVYLDVPYEESLVILSPYDYDDPKERSSTKYVKTENVCNRYSDFEKNQRTPRPKMVDFEDDEDTKPDLIIRSRLYVKLKPRSKSQERSTGLFL